MKIFLLKKNQVLLALMLVCIIAFAMFFYAASGKINNSSSIPTSSLMQTNTYTFAELYEEFQKQANSVLTAEKVENIQNIYKSKEKVAYLTFDDGPTKRCTPEILDILKENEITATFFVIGQRVLQNPDLVKRAYEEGHFIANHTFSHKDHLLYQNKESFLEELLRTDKAISEAIGVPRVSFSFVSFSLWLYDQLYYQKEIY